MKRNNLISAPSNRDAIPSLRYMKLLRAGIFKKSMGARNREGIGLSYRPARLHRLAEFIPWNQFRGAHNHLKIRAQSTKSGKNQSVHSFRSSGLWEGSNNNHALPSQTYFMVFGRKKRTAVLVKGRAEKFIIP
jgi:hypothetical protein